MNEAQTADLLNVSHFYVVKLLEPGEILLSRLGAQRRISFADLIEDEQRRDAGADSPYPPQS